MKTKRRSIVILLLICMVFTACKNNDKETGAETGENTATEAVTPTKEPTKAPTEAPTEAPTAEPTKAPTEVPATPTPAAAQSIIFPDLNFDDLSLCKTYEDQFLIGTIYTENIRNGKDKELLLKDFNVMTPENLMKPEYMQPSEGKFSFVQADAMMKFASENNLKIVGHTLAWHNQSGKWLGVNVDRETAIAQLKSHITNIVTHYKGQMFSIDVVNEAINDGVSLPKDGDWTKCIRDTQWKKSIGPDFIELAFQFAHEADPDLKLYYNDYNLNVGAKASIAAAMVKDFKSRGIPIDGIGMQGHYSTKTNINSVKKSLELFSSIEGIHVSITELDVGIDGLTGGAPSKKQELEQACFYAKLFQTFKEYSDLIERVTFWGYKDSASWRKENYPLLFDGALMPKEAYYAVLFPDEFLAKADDSSKEKKEVKTAEAIYGEAVVDAEIDELWDRATKYPVSLQLNAWQGATAEVRLMWYDYAFYALFEVKDPVLNKSSANTYERDSIELFLDQYNLGHGNYDDGTGQYRVDYEGELSFGQVPTQDGVEAAAKKTSDGYIVEIKVPFNDKQKLGNVLGFEAQVNDSNESGIRQGIAKFNDPTDSSYESTEEWGKVALKYR